VRIGGGWNWFNIVSNRALGISCVEPFGSDTKDLVN
jgi:hypothetical protein